MQELVALHQYYEEAEAAAWKAAEDAQAALAMEEKVIEENKKRDIVDVMPTIKYLHGYSKAGSDCSDDTIGPIAKRVNMEITRQADCIGRLEGELEGVISATFAQCNSINAARKGCQEIVDALLDVRQIITVAETRWQTKDKMLPDTDESVDKKMQRFKGDLDVTVVEGANFLAQGSADTAKWQVRIRLGSEVHTTEKQAGTSPTWMEGPFAFSELVSLHDDIEIEVLNPVEYSATDPVYRSRVIFRPLIEHIPELSAVTEGEYKLTIALNSNEAPPLPDLDQKTMFLQDEAKVFPHVPEEPILTLKISIRGDEPKYDELLVKIKELLIEGPPPSEREQDEINMQQASEKAVTKLGDLGTLLRQVASAAAHTAEFMPHLEVKDGTTPPARTLSPNRRVAQPSGSPMAALPSGSGGFGSSSLGAEGVAVAGGQHDRNLALGALTERLAMGLGELASRTEELPDVVAVYFKDCFAVLDPGLAMVEDSLVRDAAYAKLAKLRVHAGVQTRTAISLLAEVDELTAKEANGRILSRDKIFLEGVRETLKEAAGNLEELANVGTEGVATKAEVRELQMENRALRGVVSRGEWKKEKDNAQVVVAQGDVAQLRDALERSQNEITRLSSRSKWLAEQNAKLQQNNLVEAIHTEEQATRELGQKLEREREKRNTLETELLRAEERVSRLLQAELETKGALAKVIQSHIG